MADKNDNQSYPFESSDLKASEDAAVGIRRANAKLETAGSTSNRIGWACSAGGIRSSIFSYGVLQAFAHHGLLKHIDYMTGVSGGGFTVAHMAAKATESEPKNEVDKEREKTFFGRWGADKNTGKLDDECMTRFPVGSYLSDRVSAIGRYLFHTQFVLAFSLGLLLSAATAVAMFYRMFDHEMVRARLDFSGITLRSFDLAAAFVPAWIVLFWGFPALFVVCANNWTAKKRQVAQESAVKGGDLSPFYNPARFLAYFVSFIIFCVWIVTIMLWHIPATRYLVPRNWELGSIHHLEILAWASVAMAVLMPWLLAIGQRLRANTDHDLKGWPRWLRVMVPLAIAGSFCGLMASTFGSQPITYILSPGFVLAICLVFGEERWKSYSSFFRFVLVVMTLALVSSAMIFQGNGIATISNGSSPMSLMASGWLKFVAVVGGIVQLTVMFGLGSVIQSEQDDTQTWKRYAFSAALSVLTIVPFALAVMLIGRENISGYASHRDPDIHRNDVKSWTLLSAVIDDILDDDNDLTSIKIGVINAAELSQTADEVREREFKRTWSQYQNAGLYQGKLMGALRFCGLTGTAEWNDYDSVFRKARAVRIGTTEELSRKLGDKELTKRLAYLVIEEAMAKDFAGLIASEAEEKKQLGNDQTISRIDFLSVNRKTTGWKPVLRFDELLIDLLFLSNTSVSPDGVKLGTNSFSLKSFEQNEAEKWFLDKAALLDEKDNGMALWTWIAGHRIKNDRQLVQLMVNPGDRKLVCDLTDLPEYQLAGFNRLLIEVLYPSVFKHRFDVSTSIVQEEDQAFRGWFLKWAVILTFLFGMVSANWTPAFFHVYCERLETYFLQVRNGSRLRVRSCRTWEKGLPIPLWVATASWRYTGGVSSWMKQEPYVFSPFGGYLVDAENQQIRGGHAYNLLREDNKHIKVDYSETKRSRLMQFHEMPSLATVTGISGSAFNAFVPTHPLLRGVMFALNLQLGQWIRMPADKLDSKVCGKLVDSELAAASSLPTVGNVREKLRRMVKWCAGKLRYHWDVSQIILQLYSVIRILFGSSELPRRVFTADGGFCDGLGIEELLRRKCRLIVVSDGSFQGGVHYMQELGRAIRQAQVRSGVQFLELDEDRPVDLNRLDRGQSANVPQRFMLCRIRYPEEIEGNKDDKTVAGLKSNEAIFVYMLMSMSGVESAPLQRMRAKSPSFPDEPTANQTFSEEQTDCYRLLGYEIGVSVAKFINDDDSKTIDFAALVERLRLAYYEEVFQERGIIGDVTAAVLGQQAVRCVASQWQIDCDAPSDACNGEVAPFNRCLQKIDEWLDPILENSLETVMERWFIDTNFRMHVIAQVWLQISGCVGCTSPSALSADQIQHRMQALLLLHALAVKDLMLWDELPLRIGQKPGQDSFVGALNQTVQNTSVSKQRSSAMLRASGARGLCSWARKFSPNDIQRIATSFARPNSWAAAMWDLDFLAGTSEGRQSLNNVEQSKFNDQQRFLLPVEETVFPFAGRRIALLACICADNRLRYQTAESATTS